ncbi:MAG: hypothetical protein WKF31_00405 [Thermoleophilaceae bacterium]
MSASFSGTDYGAGETTWTTQVRDNPGAAGTFYTEAGTQSAARWDQGGPSGTSSPDGKMWVRAQATVRGRTRTLVALVAVEESPVVFPYAVLTAGWMEVTNDGYKVMVHTGNSEVQVRCSDVPNRTANPKCLNYSASNGQGVSQPLPHQHRDHHRHTP